MNSSSNRRQHANARARNSGQVTGVNNRLKKSRSPDAAMHEEGTAQRPEGHNTRRRKRPPGGNAISSSSNACVRHARQEEHAQERGRKSRHKHTDDIDMHTLQEGPSLKRQGKGRKERSQSRDTSYRVSLKSTTPDIPELDEDIGQTLGPNGDQPRMRDELETLKKQMASMKKTMGKQSKMIDDLRKDLTSSQKSNTEQSQEVEKMKTEIKKSEELITTFEANLSCQICMELLLKPYGLSPCGHALCVSCLQDWFKAAPQTDADDMYDDEPALYRKKTCPTCRAIVKTRPIPLFLVKSLASAMDKAKQLPGAPQRSSPVLEEDPWDGIFPDPEASRMMDAEWDGYNDDDEDEDEDDLSDYEDAWSFDGYGTPDDQEPYDGLYIYPNWAPPSTYIDPSDYLEEFSHEEISLLRRGATLEMIHLFSMTYAHDEGIRAIVDGHELYLGWNIVLYPEDSTGEQFIDWIMADIFDRPERWEREEELDHWSAWRLIPEDEDEEYENTDSEAWVEDIADDDDVNEDDY